MPRVYDIAGMTIRSALPLDGVGLCARECVPDIEMRLCEVPRALGGRATICGDWQWEGDSALLDVPHVARFLVSEGCRIDIAAGPGASSIRIEHALLSRVLDVLLLQRGLFAMHGKAIRIDGTRVLLLGVGRDILHEGAEQLADASREPIEANGELVGEGRIVLPGSRERVLQSICFVRPLLPRSACAEVVPTMPFAAFSWARGLARCRDLFAAADREGDFLQTVSATFAEASLYELRWPMRFMSDSELARVRQQILPCRRRDVVGTEVRS